MPSNNWISSTHRSVEFPLQAYFLATSKSFYHHFPSFLKTIFSPDLSIAVLKVLVLNLGSWLCCLYYFLLTLLGFPGLCMHLAFGGHCFPSSLLPHSPTLLYGWLKERE